jgi:NADH-quinone oxidoreductase subunit L
MTHAFFKALLFLGAGAVIHGLHGEQDLRKMGGLYSHMKVTALTLLCASIAIAGFPFTSGFFSKDAILSAAYGRAPWIYWVGVFTAGLTAFYVFRAWFMAFTGEYRGDKHPHESPLIMTGPLMVLAALALGGGFINIPRWLEPMFPETGGENPVLVWTSAGVGMLGILLAWVFYVKAPDLPGKFANALGGLYRLVLDKYRIDEVYDALVVRPLVDGSRTVLWRGMDASVIDGAVNGVGARARGMGAVMRLAQSGYIRSYAAWVVLGSVLLLLAVGLGGAR